MLPVSSEWGLAMLLSNAQNCSVQNVNSTEVQKPYLPYFFPPILLLGLYLPYTSYLIALTSRFLKIGLLDWLISNT